MTSGICKESQWYGRTEQLQVSGGVVKGQVQNNLKRHAFARRREVMLRSRTGDIEFSQTEAGCGGAENS